MENRVEAEEASSSRRRRSAEEEQEQEQEQEQEGSPEQEQSRQERRLLRARYRDVKRTIAGEKDQLVRLDSNKFSHFYNEIEDLHHMVRKPREQISDAEALLDMASSLMETVKGASRRKGAMATDVVSAVISKFGGQEAAEGAVRIDWTALGLEGILPGAPGVCTMLGPMDAVPKQRKAPACRARKEKLSQRVHVEEVEEASGSTDKQETDANMEVMFTKLRALKTVRMEALVLNRVSFSQTVENIFSLAFLVKDGRVEIKVEEDGTHLVVPRNAPSNEQRARRTVTNTQFVFGLGYKDWELMKEVLPEGLEVMPHRAVAQPLSAPQESVTPVRITSRNRARETLTQEFDDDLEAAAARKRSKRRNLARTLVT